MSGRGDFAVKCGRVVVKPDQLEWTDKNGNGKPDRGEVVDKGSGTFIRGEGLRCYRRLVGSTKPKSIVKGSHSLKRIGQPARRFIENRLRKCTPYVDGPIHVKVKKVKEDGVHFLILTVSGTKKDGSFFEEKIKAASPVRGHLDGQLAKKAEDALKTIFPKT